MSESERHQVIIVGGGAGGLELATRLGKALGKRKRADITLIDATLSHIWKPLLHEVAAGTLNPNEDDVNYLAHAHHNHFRFRLGRLAGLDRKTRVVHLAPAVDEHGNTINNPRSFRYDTLIIAIGSTTNDFNIPGVAEHCVMLDSREQADRFNRLLLRACYAANSQSEPLQPGQLHIAIAGAGATGVELSAELHDATRQIVEYGLERIDPARDIRIHLIEGAQRVLPGLPERISRSTEAMLRKLGIELHTGERISEATAGGFRTQSGLFIPAAIRVWAAGIRAPAVLRDLDGLESNGINQLVVLPTLQTTRDENIFAFGDCAQCPQPGGDIPVPPRAQAAHQQASMLVKSMMRRLAGEPLPTYRYTDYGSLVNLSRHGTVGNLMGNLMNRPGSLFVEGMFARLTYLSLYKMHQVAVLGAVRTGLLTVANMLAQRTKPRLKLH